MLGIEKIPFGSLQWVYDPLLSISPKSDICMPALLRLDQKSMYNDANTIFCGLYFSLTRNYLLKVLIIPHHNENIFHALFTSPYLIEVIFGKTTKKNQRQLN